MSKADNLRAMREARYSAESVKLHEAVEVLERLVTKSPINGQPELTDTNKRTRGRPRKWASDAERKRVKRGH